MAFVDGDYRYYPSGNVVYVSANDKTKSSYADLPDTITNSGTTYTIINPGDAPCNGTCTGCFEGCTNLTFAPKLPSSAQDLYYCFSGCSSLVLPPTIPSGTTDMTDCFYGCSNLIVAPIIPANVLYMSDCFYNCTSLSGDIYVLNNPTAYSSIFTGTTKPITVHVVNSSNLSKWQTIANSYSNVTAIYDSDPVYPDYRSHLGDQINLKSLLSKITNNIKALVLHQNESDWCMVNWSCSSDKSTYNTDYYMGSFTTNIKGYSGYLKNAKTITFTPTNNGCTVSKGGYYFIHLEGHANCTSGVYIRSSISKKVNNTLTNLSYRWAQDLAHGWVAFDNSIIAYLDADTEICPVFAKANNVTGSFRPTTTYLYVQYLSK